MPKNRLPQTKSPGTEPGIKKVFSHLRDECESAEIRGREMLEDEVQRAPHVPLRQQPDEINLYTHQLKKNQCFRSGSTTSPLGKKSEISNGKAHSPFC